MVDKMHKFIKKSIYSLLMFIALLFSPFLVKAYSSGFKQINDILNFESDNISFNNVSFVNHVNDSTLDFGLKGQIYNHNSSEVTLNIDLFFYDQDYNEVASNYYSQDIPSNAWVDYNQMISKDYIKTGSVDSIYYYTMDVSVEKKEQGAILTPSQSGLYNHFDYVIDKYDVNIKVNENNTFDVTETITAYFNISKHGIYRTIPLRNEITRLNGTTSKNRAKVTNLIVDHDYSTSRENNYLKIKIGSASYTLTGEQTYVIKYNYNIGKDPVKDYDELYYNIIGNEWDTVIGNITFTITMPKSFDSSKLGFSSGKYGSTDNDLVKYVVNDNVITGSYNGILGAGSALTIRCELPEGYFVGASTYSSSVYLMFIIPILSLVVALFIWYKYGHNENVVETVEFYPPEGFNSLEIGYLYKGKADNKDVTSLLVYLANKGYIKINDNKIDLNSKTISLNENSKNRANQKISQLQKQIQEEMERDPNSPKIKYYRNMIDVYKNIDAPIDYEQYGLKSSVKKLNKDNDFLIEKIKNYDGEKLNEQWFLEGLFEYDRTEVKLKQLYNKFYLTMNPILSNINTEENKHKLFEKNGSKKALIIILMIISLITTIFTPTTEYASSEELLITIFLSLFYIPFFAVGIFSSTPSSFRIIWLSFTTIHCMAFFSIMPITQAMFSESIYFIGVIIGFLCLISISILLSKLMKKRTPYGAEMLGKIKGFKNFLETAEKDKLEALVMENPTYFYDILPYTYVLGVSDKWIKKFEAISLQAPNWYDSSTVFDVSSFGKFMNKTMKRAESSMSSSYSGGSSGGSSSSGSSGGGSSGGGSSGGGSGGGGGGSW